MKVFQKIKSAFARGAIRVYFKGKRITFWKAITSPALRPRFLPGFCATCAALLTHGKASFRFTFGFDHL